MKDLQRVRFILLCWGVSRANSSFVLSASVVHFNSPRDMRRKFGVVFFYHLACCQRQCQNPASWADSIKMIGNRHAEGAAPILHAVDDNDGSRSIETINSCNRRRSREVHVFNEEEPNQLRKRWQAAVSCVVETQFWDGLLPTLSNRDATLLRSQGGFLASIPFTVFPTDRSCGIDPQFFRIRLFLLRFPLLCLSRSRWKVRTNEFLLGFIVGGVVDGFPLFNGAQLAADTIRESHSPRRYYPAEGTRGERDRFETRPTREGDHAL